MSNGIENIIKSILKKESPQQDRKTNMCVLLQRPDACDNLSQTSVIQNLNSLVLCASLTMYVCVWLINHELEGKGTNRTRVSYF